MQNFFLIVFLAVTAGTLGCDTGEKQAPAPAYYTRDPFKPRGSSLLDRQDEALQSKGDAVADGDPASDSGLTMSRGGGVMTFGAAVAPWTLNESGDAAATHSQGSFDLRLVEIDTSDARYAELFRRGEKLMREGRLEQALSSFDEAKTVNPRNHAAYVGETFCYMQMKNYGKALAAINFAIKNSPDTVVLYGQRAQVHAELGDVNGAMDDLARYVKSMPDDVPALAMLAQLQTKSGNQQAALRTYGKALEKAPEDPGLLINRGVTYFRLARYDEAIRDSSAAMRFSPKMVDAYFLRALCYYRLQRPNDGRADYDEAVRLGLDPRTAASWRGAFYANPTETGQP